MNYPWLFKMAWRDSRKNRARLLLFMSSIVLGIAALVAINSFSDNMQRDINNEAKELLGADLVVDSRQPFTEPVLQFFDSLGGRQSKEISFASMVLFPKNGGTRLVQVRALEGDFPYYGAIETVPENAAQSFRKGKQALADKTLLLQFDATPGDSVQVGNLTFLVEGSIEKVPGQPGIAATVAPPVYIPLQYLEETGLLQKGSRVNYKTYFKFNEDVNVDALVENIIKPRLKQEEVGFDTVEERKEEIGEAYENLTGFLNLVAFVALLLGCIGVASAVHIYVKDKITSIAILRCLGGKGKEGLAIYLIQIVLIGLLGSLAGALLGTVVQFVLPEIFAGFLPVEVSLAISWRAIAQGVLMGLVISLLFALLPLISIRNISPLTALRASYTGENKGVDKLKYVIFLLIILSIGVFSFLQLQSYKEALYFTGGVLLAFLALAGIAQLMMWLVRKYFPVGWSYIWRQSLANLYRPHNQTLVLMITIGLGTALVTTLFFVQHLLLEKVALSGSENQPNMVLFDIQSDQEERVADITREFGLPLLQRVPMVSMRLEGLKGRSVNEIKKDTTTDVSRRVLNREYRVTYRDSLIGSEEIIKGKWTGQVESPQDSIFISVEEGYAGAMDVDIGDKVTFNVQGAVIDTYVGSLREVDWQRVQTNFLILFPEGVLENAPKFHVLITRVDSSQLAADYQQAIVRQFPNVSIIDLKLILSTVDEIIAKVSFVIRFMAFFSIITGIVVLIGSVIISKYQRIRESVLLRTIGASRKQILSINALEYFFLGSLAAITGVLIAMLGSWALARFSFEAPFAPSFLPVLVTYLIITLLTMLIGLSNSRPVVNNPPLEILRSEV